MQQNAEVNTNLLEIKLLEIAVRASGAQTKASANFVNELGISEIVEKIKKEHPDLAPRLMGASHSSDWLEGFEQGCSLLATLGELTELVLEQFGEDDAFSSEFTLSDWVRELSEAARRLVPEATESRQTAEPAVEAS